ncbi:MAG: MFS transporter [Burkholderiaceae bacterium]|nr:MFS transporter [Microbacteriaceae bacterium]
MTGLRRNAAFRRFWLASTVSDFGSYLTTVALSVLVLLTLQGSALDQGIVSAGRWAPYLLFGLFAGLWVDRFRRRLVLIAGDLGRGLVLATTCLLALTGHLTVPVLVALIFAFGVLSLLGDAASQSFVPQLVPRDSLLRANYRLQQSETAAQLGGTALAGALIAAITAPVALFLDALSFLFSGAVLLTLSDDDANRRPARATTTTGQRIGEGLRFVYTHPRLAPMGIGTPIWFIGSAMLGTALPALVLLELGLGPLWLGLLLGCAGVGSVLGLTTSLPLDRRFGTGRVIIGARLVQPVAVALIALAPMFASSAGPASTTGLAITTGLVIAPGAAAAVIAVAAGQFLFGFAMGAEGPLETGYRQAVTPDRLQARMSATMRSVNRGMIVVGAPLGGAIAATAGAAAALWVAAAVMVVAALVLALSRFRTARIKSDSLGADDDGTCTNAS